MSILRDYIEDGYRIIEYTRDGETVSTVIRQLIGEQTSDEPVVIPKDPVLELQAQITAISADFQGFLDDFYGGDGTV